MLSSPQDKVLAIWREPFKLGSPTVEHWEPGLTIAQIVERMKCLPLEFANEGAVTVNGKIVPRDMWTVVRPKATSVKKPVAVTFQMPVHGKGKGGIKSIFSIIAALAITVLSGFTAAGGLAPLLGNAFGAGTLGAKILAAGISLVGSLVVSGLSSTPARSVADSDPSGGASLEPASVNGNVLEQNVAIPRVIGTRRIFPPFLSEPITEIIGQDEYVYAIYGLAGPHKIEDIRLGQASVSLTDLDTDLTIAVSDGRPGDAISIPDRYGRTFNIGTEMSVHGTAATDLSIFAPPLPVYHGMSTADDPDEVWIHLQLAGLVRQADTTQLLRIPMRIRMRRRGDSAWRYLPELHYMDNTQSQRRIQIKFRFNEDYIGALPVPPANRGFVEARKVVPAQNIIPVGTAFNSDAYFSAGAGNDIYRSDTAATTNVRRITLEPDAVTVYLSDADWPAGIYDIEIIRGTPFRNNLFTSNTYVYNGSIYDFYGSTASGQLPLSREGLLDRLTLSRIVSIRNQPPVDQKNLAMIYLTARNRSVNNLSVKASGYVNDYGLSGTWSDNPASVQANSWRAVAWSAELGLFCAVAQTGTGNRIMTSPDGITWTTRTSPADYTWLSVIWVKELGLFVACAHGVAAGTSRIMTSPNGTAWTLRTVPVDAQFRKLAWSPSLGRLVAICDIGANRAFTSPDGINWTARTIAAQSWIGLCWSPELNLFVATAYSGTQRVATSPDGITWTLRDTPGTTNSNWLGVTWSPELGMFCAVSFGGSGARNMISRDGINWIAGTLSADHFYYEIAWSSEVGLFVVTAFSGTQRIATSPDGINWQYADTNDVDWMGIVYSPELNRFVAVGENGTNNADKTMVWAGDVGWNFLTTTSNPAPHYRDILSGILNLDPLPAELHDDASLIEWRTVCYREDHTCDLIAEGVGIAELLRIVASCGYARPYQSEVWGVIRDYDRSAESPVQIFSYRNMQSFKWMKAFPRLPSGLRCNYKDDEFEYSGKQIIVYRDGADESDGRTEQVTYTGLVSRVKIQKRAEFDLLQGKHRSAVYNWSAPAEAIVCRRGTLVGVNHDTIQRHYGAARVVDTTLDGSNDVTAIVLDSRIDVKNSLDMHGVTNMHAVADMHEVGLLTAIAIRRTTGQTTVHRVSNAAGETDTLTFSPALDNPLGPASRYDSGTIREIDEDCLIVVGVLGQEYRRLIISDIQAGRNLMSTITAVDEAPEIWSSLNG